MQQCYKKLKHLETELYFQRRQLQHVLGSERIVAVEEHRSDIQTKVSTKVKDRQKRTFDALLVKQTSRDDHRNHRVVNLSSKQLEDRFNFAPVPSSIPKAHIVSTAEAAKASESVAAKVRMNVIEAISRAWLAPKKITSQEARALRDLSQDESVLVLPADKGTATVVNGQGRLR